MEGFLKCNKCGYAHFEVSRSKALEDVIKFNKYFNSLSKKDQDSFYGGKGSSIESYEKCMKCGANHTESIRVPESSIPNGVTLNPLISPEDVEPWK